MNEQIVFTTQHQFQPFSRNVAGRFAVERIAEFHVIRGKRFRHRSRGAACLKKMAGHFLASTNFCECAILRLIEINRESLTICGYVVPMIPWVP